MQAIFSLDELALDTLDAKLRPAFLPIGEAEELHFRRLVKANYDYDQVASRIDCLTAGWRQQVYQAKMLIAVQSEAIRRIGELQTDRARRDIRQMPDLDNMNEVMSWCGPLADTIAVRRYAKKTRASRPPRPAIPPELMIEWPEPEPLVDDDDNDCYGCD